MRRNPAASLPMLRLLALLLAAGLPPAAWAQGTIMQAPAPPEPTLSSGAAAAAPAPTPAGPQINAAIQFDKSERWIIPKYFQDIRDRQRRASRYKVYPRDLPAGLSQAPEPGEILPPAVLAKMEPLPKPLILELPRARPDTSRYIAGKDVLLVQRSSGKVLDVLSGIVH